MIILPPHRLPTDLANRRSVLRDYFCDKEATAVLTTNGWEITLNWSDDYERYVDPHLSIGLDWWKKDIRPSEMITENLRIDHIFHTLYDTWTLYSWSQWLTTTTLSSARSTVILHVDDHRDINVPRLFCEDGRLHDPLGGSFVDLTSPSSIQRAILSGAIGMGSFLTLFLYTFPTTEIRHLCQPPKASQTSDYVFSRIEEPDTLLKRGVGRPAIRLTKQPGAIGPGCYRITSDVDMWLKDIGKGPILLHIDLDYFNNRYDGDSDWQMRICKLDPSLDEIMIKIDELINALIISDHRKNIEDIVVAFSPSFFPAEYWNVVSDYLFYALRQIYVP